MDYAAWKLFIDAAEFGSLSKVALAYGTSQPHISRQIGELEQECGGRLFQRTGPRRGADRARAAHRAQGARMDDEHRAACERCPRLGRHADRQSADRQPALDGASAGEHALQAAEGALSADPARGARRSGLATRDLARGRQRRSRDPLPDRAHAPKRRHLSGRDIDLSCQRGRRSADVAADRAASRHCTSCRWCCSAARAAGAITSSRSAPSAAFRSTSPWRRTRSACRRTSSPKAASTPCSDPMRSPPRRRSAACDQRSWSLRS